MGILALPLGHFNEMFLPVSGVQIGVAVAVTVPVIVIIVGVIW